MMKKLFIPLFASVAAAGVAWACSFQAGHITVTVVIAAIVGLCVFFLVKAIEDNRTIYAVYFEHMEKELNNLNSAIHTLNGRSAVNEENVAVLAELQKQSFNQSQIFVAGMEKTVSDFAANSYNAVKSLQETSLKQLDGLSESLERHSAAICEKTKENTNVLAQTMDEKIGKGLDHANQMVEQFHSYIDTSCKAFQEQIASSKKEMENMLRTVTDTVASGVSDLNTAIEGSAGRLSVHVSQSLNEIWNNNVNQLLDCNSRLLKDTEKTIAGNNSKLMETHTEYSNERINKIAEQYDRIISLHMEKLKNEVARQIGDFVGVNHSVFDKTAKQIETLVSTETLFVNQLGENNGKMLGILKEGNTKQTNVITMMVEQLEKQLEEGANQYSEDIQKHNLLLIDTLTQKIDEYCDDLVGKSVEAIANVQKDNNLKLQEMCDSITEMSKENQHFDISCSENNNQIKQEIENLINRDCDFVERFSDITDKSVKNIDRIFKDYAKDMSERTDKLNMDSAKRFTDTMNTYREEFVLSNAKALAVIQKDHIDAITNANNSLARLAESSIQDKSKMHDFEQSLIVVLKQTKDVMEIAKRKKFWRIAMSVLRKTWRL